MLSTTLSPRGLAAAAASAISHLAGADHKDRPPHVSSPFSGPMVKGGTVTHELRDGRHTLTLSSDFTVPDAPAPHLQAIDSAGNVHFLQRLLVKDGDGSSQKLNRTVVVPDHIPDVKRVRIWCAWAEANLGEAGFPSAIRIAEATRTSRTFAGQAVNGGRVSLARLEGERVLALSDDFAVPATPAPHWRIVDSAGRVHLLDSLRVKGGERPDPATDRARRELVVPGYVADVAVVQIWCAWAEALLGEATFD